MRGKGINYDTGFSPAGRSSRENFDADVVRGEMRVIARELHCTAVRISGGEPARLSTAAELAAAEGLEVWFAPFPCELAADQLAPLFAECADRAEHLRRTAAWDRLSAASPRFRRLELAFSTIWGLALLAECAARLVGAYTLPVTTMVWLGTVITLGAIAVAIVAGGAAAGPIQKMIDAETAAS